VFLRQVSSRDGDWSESTEASPGGSTEGHLALNYWVYPPDNDSFDQPYASDFWSSRWRELSNVDDSRAADT